MKRSLHNLSHPKVFDAFQGKLIPIGWFEVLPGDSIQHATSLLIRTQPLNTPVMHPVHVRIRHFFCPMRLLWTDWENFRTGGPDGNNASIHPTIVFNNVALNSLADYLGVPTLVAQNVSVSALPFRMYAKVFNEFNRDQDLVNALTIDLTDGVDSTTNVILQDSAWEKDYFTTSRPWPQKGTEVVLPLSGNAPIIGDGGGVGVEATTGGERQMRLGDDGGVSDILYSGAVISPSEQVLQIHGLEADLSGVNSATVSDLRLALVLQKFKERRARFGSRYVELLRSWGVKSSDARMQRPEYLGGGKETIQFSEVLQQAPTTSGTPGTGVGTLKGHGIGAVRSNRYRRFFEEDGIVMSFMDVQPRTMYFEGLERKWNRRTKEDYFTPELAHVGQQQVLNKEIYVQGTSADEEVFGFQDKYDEYRRQEGSISGTMRTTLNTWHMARDFSSLPVLNGSFVSSNPTNRVYQATSETQLYIMAYHSIQARRMVPKMGTPFIS